MTCEIHLFNPVRETRRCWIRIRGGRYTANWRIKFMEFACEAIKVGDHYEQTSPIISTPYVMPKGRSYVRRNKRSQQRDQQD